MENTKPATQKHPLMSYLVAEAKARGDSPATLAKKLGIGYVYLLQLIRGKKSTTGLKRRVLVEAARYLNVPVAEAYLWAGALEPTDFVCEGSGLPDGTMEILFRHPQWGGFMPDKEEWERLPKRVQLLIILLFEAATGITLLRQEEKTMAG